MTHLATSFNGVWSSVQQYMKGIKILTIPWIHAVRISNPLGIFFGTFLYFQRVYVAESRATHDILCALDEALSDVAKHFPRRTESWAHL